MVEIIKQIVKMNKRLKFFVVMISFIVSSLSVVAQSNEKTVTLVVSGDGPTKDEAVKQALRSAIEQAFGTFVSANTEVLNDEVIKDEIVTISSGNITNYKEINTLHNGDGSCSATVEATVSIGNLTNFAKSKGMSVDIATGAFAMNMKIRELNKKNELQAIFDLRKKLKVMGESCNFFDYNLVIGEPYVLNDNYALNVKIEIIPNKNLFTFRNAIISTLKSLSLSLVEKEEYKRSNLRVGYQQYKEYESDEKMIEKDYTPETRIYLRNEDTWNFPILDFPMILMNNQFRFALKDNLGNEIDTRFFINNDQTPICWEYSNYEDAKGRYHSCPHAYITYLEIPEWVEKKFNPQYRNGRKSAYKYYVGSSICTVRRNQSRIYRLNIENWDIKPFSEAGNASCFTIGTGELNLTLIYTKDYFEKINNLELTFKNPSKII